VPSESMRKISQLTTNYRILDSSFKCLENDLTFKAPGRMRRNRKTKNFTWKDKHMTES